MLEALIGLASGFLSGHFGLGGGLITKPAVRMILGEPALIVVGTPMLVNIPASLVGAVSYGRRGYVSWARVRILAPAGIVGSVIGALLTPLVGGNLILLMTAGIILVLGVRFVVGKGAAREVAEKDISRRWLAVVGAAIGVVSGVLGLGGGFMLVPFLSLWLGLDMKTALGTSISVVGAITVPAALVHYSLGNVDLGLAMLLIIGAVPGTYLGARAAIRLKNESLAHLFGLVLILAATALGYFELSRLV